MNWEVSTIMFGPYWTKIGGNSGAYDGTAKLAKINVPTLLTYGEFDLVLGLTMRSYQDATTGAKLQKIKDGAHYSWFESPDEYNRVAATFLASIG